ncbi:hypothetical protein A0H81_10853 [Grifola frondosa]|uniref:Mixed lineage kinase domain-containing protein n=1 Tax=Grifola frondosa TaxID=5627 RepID=A0A1C7M214_GRIFR|nr:hypothetical protein A0H81_10853 [Grifola frondosa]
MTSFLPISSRVDRKLTPNTQSEVPLLQFRILDKYEHVNILRLVRVQFLTLFGSAEIRDIFYFHHTCSRLKGPITNACKSASPRHSPWLPSSYIENNIQALQIADKIAEPLPVPFINGVIGTALHIAETAHRIKQATDGCRDLAERVSALSLSVYEELRASTEHAESPELTDRMAALLYTLEQIDACLTRKAKMTALKRFLGRARMENDVSRLAVRMEDAAGAFQVQSVLNIDRQLTTVRRTNSSQGKLGPSS